MMIHQLSLLSALAFPIMGLYSILNYNVNLTVFGGLFVGILTLLVYYVISFYAKVRKYPPGPTPLPLIGNILNFRGKRFVHDTILSFEEKYGPVFTLWLGPIPNIFITDPKLILEVFKQKSCSGRPNLVFPEELFGKGGIDIAFSDFDRGWEVLRRVSFAAIRKYAVSDSLPEKLIPVVDEGLERMQKEEVFFPGNHLGPLVFSVTAGSALGKQYSFDDPELINLRNWINLVGDSTLILYLVGVFPFSKYFFYKQWNHFIKCVVAMRNLLLSTYTEHEITYKDGETRDFMDALIHAKKEAEKEDAHQSTYLTGNNIINSICDMMFASDSTKGTMDWWFLFAANWPDLQDKMRKEVESVLGDDDMPTIAIREKCPYTLAFLSETIRYRIIGPLNFPHKAMEEVTIAGKTIPAGTTLVAASIALLHNKEAWSDPEVFRPDRFIDEEGKFNPRPNSFYIPFSGGRRGCIGERLALSNLFLMTVRLLQKTKGHRFVLEKGKPGSAHLDGDIDTMRMFAPKAQLIRIQKC